MEKIKEKIDLLWLVFNPRRTKMLNRLSNAYLFREFKYVKPNTNQADKNVIMTDLFVIDKNNQLLYGEKGIISNFYGDMEKVKVRIKEDLVRHDSEDDSFQRIIMDSNRTMLLSGISLYSHFIDIIVRVCDASFLSEVSFKNYIEGMRRKLTSDIEALRYLRLSGNTNSHDPEKIFIGAEAIRGVMYSHLIELSELKCLDMNRNGIEIVRLKELMQDFITEFKSLTVVELNVTHPQSAMWSYNKSSNIFTISGVIDNINEGELDSSIYQLLLI